MKILIITPACNEEEHLSKLIDSMLEQSFLPVEWIIVDDGSIDNTSNVIQKAAIKYSWISYLRKEKTGSRSPGKSVIDTFYFGLNNKKIINYDIIMKLDADLVLPSHYLESIKNQFNNNVKIGVCGGVCAVQLGNDYVVEKETNTDDHIRGAIKAYRRECFEDIGGLVKAMGWDTVDEHTARYHGWLVSVIPKLIVRHQRATHQEYGFVKAAFRNGGMLYSIRMDVLLLFTNCIKKICKKPYFILGLAMFCGYIVSFFRREEKIVNQDLGKFIRKYRYSKIWEKIFQ